MASRARRAGAMPCSRSNLVMQFGFTPYKGTRSDDLVSSMRSSERGGLNAHHFNRQSFRTFVLPGLQQRCDQCRDLKRRLNNSSRPRPVACRKVRIGESK
jgi:hypothetical protein